MDALPLWPVVSVVKGEGKIGWAWDAASATNSELEEAERRPNYPMSEPPRSRPRRRDPPRQDRQTRATRHHTKKEVQLPPRPQPQAEEAPPEDEKKIRTRHLQEVERDHLPTRFHREDQRQALSKEMQEGAQQMPLGTVRRTQCK